MESFCGVACGAQAAENSTAAITRAEHRQGESVIGKHHDTRPFARMDASARPGEVAEWSNAAVSKTVEPLRVP